MLAEDKMLNKMVQQIKVLATKLDDSSSVPGNYIMNGGKWTFQKFSSDLNIYVVACEHGVGGTF